MAATRKPASHVPCPKCHVGTTRAVRNHMLCVPRGLCVLARVTCFLASVTLEDVLAAEKRTSGHAHVTPVMTCQTIDRWAGLELHWKCENFQKGLFSWHVPIYTNTWHQAGHSSCVGPSTLSCSNTACPCCHHVLIIMQAYTRAERRCDAQQREPRAGHRPRVRRRRCRHAHTCTRAHLHTSTPPHLHTCRHIRLQTCTPADSLSLFLSLSTCL